MTGRYHAESSLPSSPPLMAFADVASPTSSEPPIFSSDDPAEDEDVSNYTSPRSKRNRIGGWWEGDVEEPFVVKSYQVGVDRIEQRAQTLDSEEAQFFRYIATRVYQNHYKYTYDNSQIGDSDLVHTGLLNQVIRPPGGEGVFRSMVPELVLMLRKNRLKNLHPTLFTVENLTFLSLRVNDIKELPPQIGQLRNLVTLDLCYNRLTSLPHEAQYLFPPHGHLTDVHLTGNPLTHGLNQDERDKFLKLFDFMFPHKRNFRGPDILGRMLSRFLDTFEPSPTRFWVTAFLEYWIPRLPNLTPESNRRILMACSPIAYYDAAGRLLPGSSSIPETGGGPAMVDVQVFTEGVYKSRFAWNHFSPPPAPKGNPLWYQCLHRAIQEAAPCQLREMLYNELPQEIEHILQQAEHNKMVTYSPMLSCRCGKQYVVPRAEWLEIWCGNKGDLIPFRTRVCSWDCAEKLYRKSYLELE